MAGNDNGIVDRKSEYAWKNIILGDLVFAAFNKGRCRG